VGAPAVVDVGGIGAVEVDGFGVGEFLGVEACGYLLGGGLVGLSSKF